MSAETGAEDRRLMKSVTRGDQAALGRLYDRYGRYVHGLALRVVADRQTAEEITQDVFARVWRSAADYVPRRGAVSTWIMRIARNRSIDELRRRGVRAEATSVSWDDMSAEIGSDRPDPLETVDLELKRAGVRRAMKALPEKQRQALILAFYEGYTHSQIAETLGEPLGTVKTRLRDGMRKLRSMIGVEGGAGAP